MNPPSNLPTFRGKTQTSDDRAARRRFYNSREWRDVRRLQLSLSPLCELCLKADRVTPGEHVHHLVKLADDRSKGLALDNLQTLCAACHNSLTGRGY